MMHQFTEAFNVCSRCTIEYGMQTTLGMWWKIGQLLSWFMSCIVHMYTSKAGG